MATLILKFGEDVQGEFQIKEGQSLTIGRKEGNDVVIENLVVSGSHAKIDSLPEGFLLTDLRSKNGTFVNENPINSHWLKDGDVVRIGKHTLTLALDDGEAFAVEAEDSMDQTMVFGTGEFRHEAAPKAASAILSFLKGGQGDIPLTKKLTKIGKDFSNDVVISGFTVGQTAATISKLPEGFFINYVGGMAKPKVNGKTVSDTQRLDEFDTIEIGAAKMQFLLTR